MEKRRRRFGDRKDGRRLRTLSPMHMFEPFIMKDRCDGQNYFNASIDCDYLEDYIRQMKEELKAK